MRSPSKGITLTMEYAVPGIPKESKRFHAENDFIDSENIQ